MGSLSGAAVMSWEDKCCESKPAAAVSCRRAVPVPEERLLLILLFGVIVFTCCPAPEFISLDARFALFAQEMLRNGPSFFPTTYDTPYPDYPATSTFLIYLVSLPLGRVTPFTAVLPTAVVSALILVVTYRIGAMRSRKRGLAAVLFALFTVEFLVASRSIALDQYTSLATALSFYLVYSCDCLGRSRRLWLLPLAWFLGFAFRGPVGLAIPAAATGGYYLWTAQFKRMVLVGITAGCMLILCFCGLLLAARFQGGTPFMKQVIVAQVTGRFGERGPGFGYYWYGALISYAVTYPLAILVVASRFGDVVTQENRRGPVPGRLDALDRRCASGHVDPCRQEDPVYHAHHTRDFSDCLVPGGGCFSLGFPVSNETSVSRNLPLPAPRSDRRRRRALGVCMSAPARMAGVQPGHRGSADSAPGDLMETGSGLEGWPRSRHMSVWPSVLRRASLSILAWPAPSYTLRRGPGLSSGRSKP